MEFDMVEGDLPEDYLSPRSKVARMLADIDNGPTPSPSPAKPGQNANKGSLTEKRTLGLLETSSSPSQSQAKNTQQPSSRQLDEDEDDMPTRPAGRAARRMLNNEDSSEDDLYSATPMKSRRSKQSTPSHQATVSPRGSSHSGGLFVSPARARSASGSDDDLPDLSRPSRLAELVAAKRAERLAKENADRSRQSERASSSPAPAASSDLPDDIVEVSGDAPAEPHLDKILSDAARPTRKASKKAMLEMERETQRLAREQALTHQMKTKKKFTNADLFARMNFRQAVKQQESGSSSAPNSDGAEVEHAPREPLSTPPSSPPTPWDTQKALVQRGALARMVPVREDSISSLATMAREDDDEDDLLDVKDIIKQAREAKAATKHTAPESPTRATTASRMRIKLKNLPTHHDDSDEDLDVVQPMPAHLRVFDNVRPMKKNGEAHSKAMHALKHLAHLNHDNTTARSKKVLKPVIPPNAVNAQLIATAKAQARRAQEERLAELRAKGIAVMSAEEQEREHDQFENLLDKAREEADQIRRQEKAARRKENGENHALASDDEDEDEDWQDSEEDEDAADSEKEDLIDDAAEDSASDEESLSDGPVEPLPEQTADEAVDEPSPKLPKVSRKPRIIVDEDDEEEEDVAPTSKTTDPVTQGADDPFAAFGFDAASGGPSLMSPTQAFAATMQTPTQLAQSTPRSSTGFYSKNGEHPPPPTFGQLPSQDELAESQSQLVPASQLQEETQAINLDWGTQMPETPIADFKYANANAIETPGWEPSQDAGLPSPWTAARRNQAFTATEEHETQSTVRVRISESPEAEVVRNRGRLTRGVRVVESDEDEPVVAPVKKTKNAFTEMQQLRMQSMSAADRAAAQKEMKDMMDDQAEESEDEYAGLGGDDSNMIAPETEEDRAMIDHSYIETDEREAQKMQKFFAERQRVADEEATSKLYKDLTTGALRRRQGVGWELDEDEDELAARRRQIRQREEIRKRRLLLQDDNVKGLLEGKGNSKGREAFLRTIGDDDDSGDFIDAVEAEVVESSQQDSQTEPVAGEPLREISNNKRPLEDSQGDLPAAKTRRTRADEGAFSRPSSMVQVRESLSFLLDEPAHAFEVSSTPQEDNDVGPLDSQYDDDDPVEEELSRDNDGGFAPDIEQIRSQEMPPPPLPTDRLPASQRRTPAKDTIIDRMSLRRGSSSSSSTSSIGWSAWSTGSGSLTKVPSLLRKATSNLSTSSNTNERGVSYGNSKANDRGVSVGNGTRMGGSKKSSLAYQSRAQERKALGERAERKKEESRRKIAEIRRQQGGALVGGGLQSGQWE